MLFSSLKSYDASHCLPYYIKAILSDFQGLATSFLQVPSYLNTHSIHFLFFFFQFLKIEVELIYNVVPISAVQQSDSVIHIETFFFYILFHYGLSQQAFTFFVP